MSDEGTQVTGEETAGLSADSSGSTQGFPFVSDTEPGPLDEPVGIARIEEPLNVAATSATAQGPEPATATAGSRIALIVSRGPSAAQPAVPLDMPEVLGYTQGVALARLQALGLTARVINDHNDQLPAGYVTGQYPEPEQGAQPGSEVMLLVSTGRSKLPAPDVMLPSVVGLDQSTAADVILSAGLVPVAVETFDPVAAPGLVLGQIPGERSQSQPLHRRGGKLWIVAVAVLVAIAAVAGAILFLNRPTAIPNLVGLTQAQAENSVRSTGFRLGSVVTSQTANEKEIGSVVGQAPLPGGTAANGSTIDLIVAGGQLLLPVPNVVGMSTANGIQTLRDAGLAFSSSLSYDSKVASGSVVAQAPVAGQRVPPGTTVGLNISRGAQTITVPAVVGQIRTSAETALKSSGLGVATASNYNTATPVGQVMGQQPTVGTGVPPGTYVGITVSKGIPPIGITTYAVPNVVGKSASKAKSTLHATRLKYVVVTRMATGRPKNQVIAQLPDMGAILPRNSVVILFVSDGS